MKRAAEHIFSILSASQALASELGASSVGAGIAKIYDSLAPEGERLPYIVIDTVSVTGDLCVDGVNVLREVVQVSVFANAATKARSIASLIFDIVAAAQLPADVRNIRYLTHTQEVGDDAHEGVYYSEIIDFEIIMNEL
ncbi:MAG: hypothetical protein KatS3mg031_2990 [Chitinophagales bacterium]|nr:MAG: hypothetical protein KatS3mg031_2919 [Chitinophagales bacterium]GIV35455.1 MAG: hypothetical protein KatS3mg031_2990 [Chitinophagales bacterium]